MTHAPSHSEQTGRVLITGATGLIGTSLGQSLQSRGYEVVPVSRSTARSSQSSVRWMPNEGRIDVDDLEGADMIVHLAGESIAAVRWTAKKKQAILDSRVKGTTLLSEAISKMKRKPKVFVCASAIGIYGNRDDELLDENSTSGDGFLADVCRQWEASCEAARQAGVRVVNGRFGMVLSSQGGALQAMIAPFRLGVGGVVGSGRQWWSWIALEDAVKAITFALEHDELHGPINVVSPVAIRNREFTKVLGRVLARPTILPLPSFAARLVMGDMADELLLASVRVQPKRLIDAGFEFQWQDLEAALRKLLEKN